MSEQRTIDERASHTPGPWLALPQGSVEIRLKWLQRDHWQVGQESSPHKGVALVFGDTEANARLIAAAPEMLALLKRAIAGVVTKPHKRKCICEVCETRAVIAKAEGAT